MHPHTENSILISNYDYDIEGILSKRHATSSMSKWYTSSHTALRLLILTDGIAFTRKTVDIIEDTEEVQTGHYLYTDLDSAKITRQSVKLKELQREYTVTSARLIVRDTNGNIILSASVSDDMDSEHLAEQINKLIAKATEE